MIEYRRFYNKILKKIIILYVIVRIELIVCLDFASIATMSVTATECPHEVDNLSGSIASLCLASPSLTPVSLAPPSLTPVSLTPVSLALSSFLPEVGGWIAETSGVNPFDKTCYWLVPQTFDEFLERLNASEFIKVEVEHRPYYGCVSIAKPEGPLADLVKYPLLPRYNHRPNHIPGVKSGWNEVVGAVRGHNDFICILKGAKPFETKKETEMTKAFKQVLNCPTLPKYLKPEYTDQYSKEFERLCECQMNIPDTEEQLCIGTGIGKRDNSNYANYPMVFRVTTRKGIEHEFSIIKLR